MPPSILTTYRDYLNLMTESPQSSAWDYAACLEEINRVSLRTHMPSAAEFIVDYQTRQYPFVSQNAERVLGHSREAFLEGGLDFMLDHYHDFQVMNTQIFPDELRFLAVNTLKMDHIRFTRSYRFRTSNGKHSTILQQYTLITGSGSKTIPVAVFGFVLDITPFAEKGKIIHQIEQYDPVSANWSTSLLKEYYPDIDPERLLGKREVEILKWAVEGYSSKQIAEKLYLSVNTVNTHRRNMLRKTNCRNSMELLRYAIERKLL